jgi:hypothetical protein
MGEGNMGRCALRSQVRRLPMAQPNPEHDDVATILALGIRQHLWIFSLCLVILSGCMGAQRQGAPLTQQENTILSATVSLHRRR